MNPALFLKIMKYFPLGLVLGIDRRITAYYRACFLSTLLASPCFERLARGPMTSEQIAAEIGARDMDALRAWLDFGTSLGLLKASSSGYQIKDRLGRKLAGPGTDAWRAYFRLRVEGMHEHFARTPEYLAKGGRIALRDEEGGLYADSSRTTEALLMDIVAQTTPGPGPRRLLEVGCGSGVYLKKACEVNPELSAVGVEMQASTARIAEEAVRSWGLAGRVSILNLDIRKYKPDQAFDLVTLHNLIYYFPVRERAPLLALLKGFVKPGGRFVITTLCDHPAPSIRAMNLWSAMTEGSGPLPKSDDLEPLLREAGFSNIHVREVFPAYYCAEGKNSA